VSPQRAQDAQKIFAARIAALDTAAMAGKQRASGALTQAARANGCKGGRPKKTRNAEPFAEAGAPPTTDALAIIDWVQWVINLDTAALDTPEHDALISTELRKTANALAKLIDAALLADALGIADFDAVDPAEAPPRDALQAGIWNLGKLLAYMHATITGRPDAEFGAQLRGNVRAWAKVLPPDVRVIGEQTLRERVGPSEGGPPMEPVTTAPDGQPRWAGAAAGGTR
jgi:hypothetical protein